MQPLAPAMILVGPPVIPVPAETTVITHSRRTFGRRAPASSQNSGSLPAAAPRGCRRGGREGAAGWSAAWTASATSCAVSASMGDVAAEQHAADDLPGVPGRILRVGGHCQPSLLR